jgi:hypothetical protein
LGSGFLSNKTTEFGVNFKPEHLVYKVFLFSLFPPPPSKIASAKIGWLLPSAKVIKATGF